MSKEIYELDPEALLAISDTIVRYCASQRETMNAYQAQILALNSEWQDDKTFGSMFEEISLLKHKVVAIMDEVERTYPVYFREKARQILERPSFGDNNSYQTRVVEDIIVPIIPVVDTPSHSSSTNYDIPRVTYGEISSTTRDFAFGRVADTQFVSDTFNVLGNTPQLSQTLKSSFSNSSENVMAGIYRTTDRLEFTSSSQGTTYMPCNATTTAGKSVISVDLNSKTVVNDIVTAVGKHVFYCADNDEYYELLDSLREEANNKEFASSQEYQSYLKSFKESTPVDEKYGDERTSKKAYNTSSGFFEKCFTACVKKDENTIAKLEKYFPKSFGVAVRIIDKQTDALTWGD